MDNLFLRKNIFNNTLVFLIGKDIEFKAEHQFFNIACLLGTLFYSFFIIINIVFNVDYTLTVIKSVSAIVCLILYYYSRFKKQFSWTSSSFFLLVLCSYLFIGIKNGGVTGGIAPIYIAVLTFMLFITEGRKRIILLLIWVFSISSLFLVEYYRPNIITYYSNSKQKYIDIYLSYFSGILMVAFVVITVKKLYKKEQLNVEELIQRYRTSGDELKQIISHKMMLLSVREREICKLLLQGQSNKEIAENLFITEGTVKSHLNKIYKKLEASNRVEVINLMREI